MDATKRQKEKGKTNVQVDTLTAVYNFTVSSSTTGMQLFEQVALLVGLRQVWPFGLCYTDRKKLHAWLSLRKKVLSQDVGKKRPVQLKLRVRFYPEDAEELTDPASLRQVYLEVQQAVMTSSLQCPVEVAIQLAAHALQATHSDQNLNTDQDWMEVSLPLSYCCKVFTAKSNIASRVIFFSGTNQWDVTDTQWKLQVVRLYESLKGMNTQSAMLEYVKLAQQTDGFGVSNFDVRTKGGKGLTLGVSALGMRVHGRNSQESAVVFLWGDILSTAFSGKTFTVKMVQKTSPDFVFVAGRVRTNKQILALCIGNYELFIARRQSAEEHRKERMSELPCAGETREGSDERGGEAGTEESGAVSPGEDGVSGVMEVGIVPLGEGNWEEDGEKEGESLEELSITEGGTSSLWEDMTAACRGTNQREDDLIEYVLNEGRLDEGDTGAPPIPPKSYLLGTTSGHDDNTVRENENLDKSGTEHEHDCHPATETRGTGELWVTFDNADGVKSEFESTLSLEVPPPFLVVRHGLSEVTVRPEVTTLEVTPMSRSLGMAAIRTTEDVEEECQPLRYSGTSVVNTTSVHSGAPLPEADVHKVQILSFNQKGHRQPEQKTGQDTDRHTLQAGHSTTDHLETSICQGHRQPEQKTGQDTDRHTLQAGHSTTDHLETSICQGNTKLRVMLFEAM